MVVVVRIIINVVFGIVIAVVVVNNEDPTLSPTFRPVVGIIIIGVDKAKGPIIGVRGLDTAVG